MKPKKMNYQKEEPFIKNFDRLGIVAGIVDEIGITEKINDVLETDTRERVNAGEVVKAIILNGLGFVSFLKNQVRKCSCIIYFFYGYLGVQIIILYFL